MRRRTPYARPSHTYAMHDEKIARPSHTYAMHDEKIARPSHTCTPCMMRR